MKKTKKVLKIQTFVLVVALKRAVLSFERLQKKNIFKLLKLVCEGSEAS